jgi:hypothetical protein
MLIEKFRKLKKYDPEVEQKLREDIESAGGLEKNDVKAMILAAFLVIMPVALVILGLFGLMAFLFF